MYDSRTTSWIFLAVAMASNENSARISDISLVADGINHAVPTQKELQTSLRWLIERGLITRQGTSYCLTSKGKTEYGHACANVRDTGGIWENLDKKFKTHFDD